ncbi:hypothetical protein HK097_004661 [Rhizophlyctis rosea]|uniref:Uncharacterized protein n=1 Tax=Rhizophlyctis rosea TaxID=64517 RepID=A0AAD5SER4_9FUNG|nr:hypothetical protein HK097_004661 [Rhizophlyctis rosea]
MLQNRTSNEDLDIVEGLPTSDLEVDVVEGLPGSDTSPGAKQSPAKKRKLANDTKTPTKRTPSGKPKRALTQPQKDLIVELVAKHGTNWKLIAAKVNEDFGVQPDQIK